MVVIIWATMVGTAIRGISVLTFSFSSICFLAELFLTGSLLVFFLLYIIPRLLESILFAER